MILSIISAILIQWNIGHPFHVSVCDVEHDEESRALQITHHIFLDDLEQGIRRKFNNSIDIVYPEDKEERDKLIKDYVMEHFAVDVNGKPQAGNYLGHEFEPDAIYCFIEIEGVRKMKNITIRNSLLTEIFDDQINLVHVKVNGKIRSMKLDKKNNSGQLSYSD